VDADTRRPHGIRYSFTLHDRDRQRVLGYDNAHAAKDRIRTNVSRKTQWDHRHEEQSVHSYTFISAEQLLVDFWSDVEALLSGSKDPTK
jgi:hypothetical protein